MKINKKIVLAFIAMALMPIMNAYAAGPKITAAQAFYALAKQNNTAKIKLLQDKGYSLESTDRHGYNPVCMAIMRQDHLAYRALVSQGANRKPACVRKIPENTLKRFFGLRYVQPATTTSKYAANQGIDVPTWLAAGALGTGAIVAAVALRGDTNSSSDTPTPTPTCPNGKYDSEKKTCTCNEGYNHYGDDQACYAPIPGCEKQQAGNCTACGSGYKLYNNACYPLVPHCDIQTESKCTQCSSGYGIHGGDGSTCYKNIENCAIQQANTCTQCSAGYDTYGDDSKMQCYKTIDNCQIQLQTACQKCVDGYDTYDDPTGAYCYHENPCAEWENTAPRRTGDGWECVCNVNKGYTGEPGSCTMDSGSAQEGDGNRDKRENYNELYCNSHGKYIGNYQCQCYTSKGYGGQNSNCNEEECCSECIPGYKKDSSGNDLCYIELVCPEFSEQIGNSCVCDAEHPIFYNNICYEDAHCGRNERQQGLDCVCKPNYDDQCEECKMGYHDDGEGNCVINAGHCEEKWYGTMCNLCPAQYAITEDALGNKHCGLACASNRKPIEEDETCSTCADGWVEDNGQCIITNCSIPIPGYIEKDGECVCDTENGYVLTRTGTCELKGEDIIGIRDSNINNDNITKSYNGAAENAIHDVYGMKPVVDDSDSENIVYYDEVYNALSFGGDQTAEITIENTNSKNNTIYGIYQPHAIYNAAVVNNTANNATAIGNITINDTNTTSVIYGLYNTTEISNDTDTTKDIHNALATASGKSSASAAMVNQATGNITITKDINSTGTISGIHGVGDIYNARADTSEGIGSNVEANGNITITHSGSGDAIGIESITSGAYVNNALSYLDSAVSNAVSTGNINLKGNSNVYGISAKGMVANSETEFNKSFNIVDDFSSTGTIDVTVQKSGGKAYGIYVTGSSVKANIYNALGYKSTGTIIATNNGGGSAYGIWSDIADYKEEGAATTDPSLWNNIYNAFRSSDKYGGTASKAQGNITININGTDSSSQEGVGIYSAGDAFNAYAKSGGSEALEVEGNINVVDNSRTQSIMLKGLEANGATIANAYATGVGINTTTMTRGNINVSTTGYKDGPAGSASGMYSTKKIKQTAQIYNAALINDTSNVEGNITVQATEGAPFGKMYGIYTTNYDISGGSEEDASEAVPKEIYNAYYSNGADVTGGTVKGTIKVINTVVSGTSNAEYYGIFTNGGRAYNVYSIDDAANVKGIIEVDVAGGTTSTTAAGMYGINNAQLFNTGKGENSLISVTTSRNNSNAYGMKGEESDIYNDAVINVTSKAASAYGLYVIEGTATNMNNGVITVDGHSTSYGIYARNGTAINNGTINVNSNTANYGMFIFSTDEKSALAHNTGTININGTGQNVGIFAQGENAKVLNTGIININGVSHNDVCEGEICDTNVGIVLRGGAELIVGDGGEINSTSNINFSEIGHVTIAPNGKISSLDSISGDLDVDKNTVMDNFADEIVLEDALNAADVSQANVGIASYLYKPSIKANSGSSYDIVLDMRDFAEITANSGETAYLEQNYNAEKNTALFNALKATPTATATKIAEANAMGTSFIPNIPEEELKVQRSLNRTMTDELFKDGDDVRKFVGVDAMKVGRSDSGTLTGYDINSQSTYALYDKKMNNNYRLGLGMSFTHTNTDYNNDSRRKNFNIQGYIPLTYKLSNRLTAVSMAELGYSDGDYTRRGNAKSFKADTSAIIYGLLNEMRYKANLGPVNITPFVGLNAIGWYQDSISEGTDAQALHLAATNIFSLESALGLYVDKNIEFNEDNRLNIALGAGYYHEFADPYRGFDAHHTDSVGKYRLKNKIHSDDRGIISARLKYDYKAFSIYAELLHYLEEEHPTEFDGGLQYRF